jgi:hypothetical protein
MTEINQLGDPIRVRAEWHDRVNVSMTRAQAAAVAETLRVNVDDDTVRLDNDEPERADLIQHLAAALESLTPSAPETDLQLHIDQIVAQTNDGERLAAPAVTRALWMSRVTEKTGQASRAFLAMHSPCAPHDAMPRARAGFLAVALAALGAYSHLATDLDLPALEALAEFAKDEAMLRGLEA